VILDFLSSGITCRTRDRRMWRRHYRQLTLGPEVKCSIKKGGGGGGEGNKSLWKRFIVIVSDDK